MITYCIQKSMLYPCRRVWVDVTYGRGGPSTLKEARQFLRDMVSFMRDNSVRFRIVRRTYKDKVVK